jgi:hypothetical protein
VGIVEEWCFGDGADSAAAAATVTTSMRCDVNIGSLLLSIVVEQGSVRAECFSFFLSFFLSFFTFIPLFDETSDSRQDATLRVQCA